MSTYEPRVQLYLSLVRLCRTSASWSAAVRLEGSREAFIRGVLHNALEEAEAELRDGFDVRPFFDRLETAFFEWNVKSLADDLPEPVAKALALAFGRVLKRTMRSEPSIKRSESRATQMQNEAQQLAGIGVKPDCDDPEVKTLQTALAQLAEDEKAVVRLKMATDMTHRQIAKSIGMTEKRVGVVHRTAMKRITRWFIEQGFEIPGPSIYKGASSKPYPGKQQKEAKRACDGTRSDDQGTRKTRKHAERAGDRDAGKQEEESPDENHRGRMRRISGFPACRLAVRIADRGRHQQQSPRRDPHHPMPLVPVLEHMPPRFAKPNQTASTAGGQFKGRVCAEWSRNPSRTAA